VAQLVDLLVSHHYLVVAHIDQLQVLVVLKRRDQPHFFNVVRLDYQGSQVGHVRKSGHFLNEIVSEVQLLQPWKFEEH